MLVRGIFRGAGINGDLHPLLPVSGEAMAHQREISHAHNCPHAMPKVVAKGGEGNSRQRGKDDMQEASHHPSSTQECEKSGLAAILPGLGDDVGGVLCGIFLRAGELTVPSQHECDPTYHLNFTAIVADHPSKPSVIHLKIKASKTDLFRIATIVVLEKTGKDLCLVEALLTYLKRRGQRAGWLFIHSNCDFLAKLVWDVLLFPPHMIQRLDLALGRGQLFSWLPVASPQPGLTTNSLTQLWSYGMMLGGHAGSPMIFIKNLVHRSCKSPAVLLLILGADTSKLGVP